MNYSFTVYGVESRGIDGYVLIDCIPSGEKHGLLDECNCGPTIGREFRATYFYHRSLATESTKT